MGNERTPANNDFHRELSTLVLNNGILCLSSMCPKLQLPVTDALPEVCIREGNSNITQGKEANQMNGLSFPSP